MLQKNIINTRLALDNLRMSKSESQEAATMRIEAGAGPNFGCKVIVQAQDSHTASSGTRQTRKRKIGGVDTIDKENVLFPNGCGTLTIKRICWEKTGTDWQTVLDVIAYGEEQRNRRDKDMDLASSGHKSQLVVTSDPPTLRSDLELCSKSFPYYPTPINILLSPLFLSSTLSFHHLHSYQISPWFLPTLRIIPCLLHSAPSRSAASSPYFPTLKADLSSPLVLLSDLLQIRGTYSAKGAAQELKPSPDPSAS
ncbi:uncharacterized protein EDB91DRAFT_1253292 [Suillus paluster]|uniref:uncharacterized protein n=1 Tax=Suillus paluster TaxID=48578 RepID=UPI001B8675E6|nr:uncharacterized protein EDB91DRAFT_1253292 [Suillus paluster]KAG1728862.1 hypothetical protein EDB91DRAFT_1253292 [Suillus paluster]